MSITNNETKSIPIRDACNQLDIPLGRMKRWIDHDVFSATDKLTCLQPDSPLQGNIPLACMASLGLMWDFVKVRGEDYSDMTTLWQNMVDTFIDVLLLGDVPNCVVITDDDIEILIGEETEYPVLIDSLPTVIFFDKRLLKIGGWI